MLEIWDNNGCRHKLRGRDHRRSVPQLAGCAAPEALISTASGPDLDGASVTAAGYTDALSAAPGARGGDFVAEASAMDAQGPLLHELADIEALEALGCVGAVHFSRSSEPYGAVRRLQLFR